jgi:TolB-like protein/tetratricopeptide (TPR) repeat protein
LATVFLSYAREDTKRVRPVIRALEGLGHIVWWDEHVPGGEQFTQAIQQALEKADAVVVCWTATSAQSAWVRDEAAFGRDNGQLVPVTLDGSLPPLGFREYQAIDLSSWGGRTAARQIESLNNAIAAKAGQKAGQPRLPDQPHARRPSKLFWTTAAAAAAALTTAGLIATGLIENPVSAFRQETPSIAVLPFTDLSPARDKAYFAEGVGEEILSSLAAVEGVKVLGRTSSRQIEKGADSRELRRRLGVTHLLEGSARSAGDQLRVNVRLIDTSDGRQVWEEEYQGRPADVFAVQDQIARAVVKRLRGTLFSPNIRKTAPTDAATFQTYLAARALMRTRTEESLREALALARKVVSGDSRYAPGHALLAELYYLLSDDYSAYGSIPLEQARKLGIPHAKEAIRLAPDAPEGYAALGLISSHAEAMEPLRRAILLDASRGELRLWFGFTLNELGRHDEALAQYRSAAQIDPLGFAPVNRLVQALAAAGQDREAVNVVRQFVARGGDSALQHPMMMEVATWRADPSAVIAHGRLMLAREPVRHLYFRLFAAAAFHALGHSRQAATTLLSSQQLYGPYYAGDEERLRRNIARAGAKVWNSPEGSFAFVRLANNRDWPSLVRLFDGRDFTFAEFCEQWPNVAAPFAMALRSQGRANQANQVLGCLRNRLAVELRNKARLPQEWPGDLEFRRASLSALDGDREGALRWLDRSVSRGWMGQPYSSRLTDYPQFDALLADRRFGALQRRVDARIARERAELASESGLKKTT